MFGYVSRNISKGLVYNGDIINSDDMTDSVEAVKWFNQLKDIGYKFKEYELDMYGIRYKIAMPIVYIDKLKEKEIEHIKGEKDTSYKKVWNREKELKEKLREYARIGYIDDIVYGIWDEIFQYIGVYRYMGIDCFVDKVEQGLIDKKRVVSSGVITEEDNIKLVLMKEWLMGFRVDDNLRELEFKFKDNDKSKIVRIDIGHDYNFELLGKEYDVKDNYTVALRKNLFLGAAKARQRINNLDKMPPLLYKWQFDLIKKMGKRTVFTHNRRCLWEEHKIRMEDGGYKRLKEIEIGDVLYGGKEVVDKWNGEKECYKILFDGGDEVICSLEHRFVTADNYKGGSFIGYKKASELVVGDYIPSVYDIYNNGYFKFKGEDVIDKDMGWLLGYIIGDGGIKYGGVSITKKDKTEREYVANRLDKMGIDYSIVYDNSKKIHKINIRGIVDKLKLFGLYHKGSKDKTISNLIFKSTAEIKWSVIEGLLQTDGYLGIRRKRNYKDGYNRRRIVFIEYSSSSYELVKGMHVLLSDLGIISFFRRRKKKVMIKGDKKIKEYYYIYIGDIASIRKIIDACYLEFKTNYKQFINILYNIDGYTNSHIGLIPKCAKQELKVKGDVNGNYNFQRWKLRGTEIEHWGQFYWKKIIGIEKIGIKKVVDIEITGDKLYQLDTGILTHNSGKTLLMSYLLLASLFKENLHKEVRPRSIIYLGEKEKNLFAILNYLLNMKEKFGEVGDKMFKYSKSEKQFMLLDPKTGSTRAIISFLFASETSPGIGHFCDDLFIDEAARIPDKVVEGVMPFVTHEGAGLVAASTMYHDIKKGWFYDMLLEYEQNRYELGDINNKIIEWYDKGEMPEYNIGIRYTIDDNEGLTEKQKEALKREYKKKPVRYFTELYSRFPDEMKVFRYAHTLQPREVYGNKFYKYIVIGYDPALTGDRAAVIVSGYDPDKRKIVILEEHILNIENKFSYRDQIPILKDIINGVGGKYANNGKTYFVMDGTTRAIAEMLEMNGLLINLRVFYGSGDGISQSRTIQNEINVPKKELVEIGKVVFENSKIVIVDDLIKLRKELDNFSEISKNRYEAIKGHDDLVNAMLLTILYFYEYLGIKYDLIKAVEEDKTGLLPDNKVIGKTLEDIIAYRKRKNKDSNLYGKGGAYFTKFIW